MSEKHPWSPDLDRLLKAWKKQISTRSQQHKILAETYQRRHYLWGAPPLILGAVISSGGFASVQNCDPSVETSALCIFGISIRVMISTLGLAVSGMTAFNMFMRYLSHYELHKKAADEYESLARSIDTILRLPYELREDSIATMQLVREQFDVIVKNSPNLPTQSSLDYEVVAPPPRPTISTVSTVEIPDVSQLQGVLADTHEAQLKKSDTAISFDLDSIVANPNDTRAAQQQLNTSKYNQGLEFEMSRLAKHSSD